MGLPQTIINFQSLATTLTQRTQNGIVALLLKDDTPTASIYIYVPENVDTLNDGWTVDNKAYIKQAFIGGARKVFAVKVGTTTPTLATALQTLGNKLWDYLAYPDAVSNDIQTVVSWIKTKRDTDKKTYKFVGSAAAADHEGIINFTTDTIKDTSEKVFESNKFTARIAGIIAGVGTESSCTYYTIPEVISIKDLADDTARDTAIDNGELILINDGEKVKIARGVNSLKTINTSKGESFKKIRVVEIVDTMRDDISTTIDNDYKGKVLNTYANKLLLIAAINSYFSSLEKENVLDIEYSNLCEIDYSKQREYIASIGIKVDNLSTEEILKFNTNDKVFLKCNIKIVDAMEDFTINIYM